MNLCLIPARGGSKRIPRKNIKDFCGKPIIVWSIEKAIASNIFDSVVVSTDDLEIAKIASENGASVPFIRPTHLSHDKADTWSVVVHAIKWLIENKKNFQYICCLYPTAPLLDLGYLHQGYEEVKKGNFDFSVSVSEFCSPPQMALKISKEGGLEGLMSNFQGAQSQELVPSFYDSGQFYWGSKGAWMQNNNLLSNHSKPIFIPRHSSQDINTLADWEFAEHLFRNFNNL